MSVYIFTLLQTLEKCLIMISPKNSITATIEGSAIDSIYVGELETHTVLTNHCATYSAWPGPMLIVLYLALTAKTLDTFVYMHVHMFICLFIRVFACSYVYMFDNSCVCMFICLYVCLFMCLHVHMIICLFSHVFACSYVHMLLIRVFACSYDYMLVYLCVCMLISLNVRVLARAFVH